MSEAWRVRFVRNFTLEPIEMWLRKTALADGIEIQCEFGAFSGAAEEIHSWEAAPDHGARVLTVLALCLETTSSEFGHAGWAIEAVCQNHLALIQAAIHRCEGPLLINTVLAPLFSASGLASSPCVPDHAEQIAALNIEIRRLARVNAGRVALADWQAIAMQLGEKGTYDYRFWYSSGAPFASGFLSRYAESIEAMLRALAGKARKCLVLDCDNTLWGGVVGEDGPTGIKLAADALPGAYFTAFQRAVLDLQRRGVLIALCSKNDEAAVLEIIDNHPGCLIRREHLATWRVDWNEKVQSIAEIAAELNIGRDALVFVDDSDMECELVRRVYPEVAVLKVPGIAERLVGLLERHAFFDTLTVTEADLTRTQTYQQNRLRDALSGTSTDLSQYKKELGTRLTVRSASVADLPRIVQLMQRTNQFNLTTRRHAASAIELLCCDEDALLLCAHVSDRFGDLGLVGVALVVRADGEEARVDSMLMSCRALGRDAEVAFGIAVLRWVKRAWAIDAVVAEYVPTSRNGLVTEFWPRLGFAVQSSRGEPASVQYRRLLDAAIFDKSCIPPHVELVELSHES